mmetsp:Transcript_3686/g.7107  ORF Transcript_3686/g.7107 Transcript_3686/m.7107 type:complete len:90 (-) Transcript_3686:286-555(-)
MYRCGMLTSFTTYTGESKESHVNSTEEHFELLKKLVAVKHTTLPKKDLRLYLLEIRKKHARMLRVHGLLEAAADNEEKQTKAAKKTSID